MFLCEKLPQWAQVLGWAAAPVWLQWQGRLTAPSSPGVAGGGGGRAGSL